MPLQLVNDQTGYAWVNGITSGGAALPLGSSNLSLQIGPHFVGFDTSYNSLVKLSAAYDPSLDPEPGVRAQLARCAYVGYIQFARLRFLGQPIPPELFTGPLGQFQPYASQSDFGDELYEFVNFMGPAEVNAYLARQSDPTAPLDPFFAVNSALFEPVTDITQLFTYPHVSGALLGPNPSGPNDARGAVLRGNITMTQIDEAQIAAALNGRTPLATLSVTPEQVANGNVGLLGLQAVAQQPTLDPDEQSVSRADITRGRQVGPYTLLSVANDEDEEPVLCVSVTPDSRTVLVHLLPWEDVEQLERQNTNDLLARIAANFAARNISLPGVALAPPRGRGTGGGLSANAFPWLSGPCLELRFRTAAFGRLLRGSRSSPQGIVPLSGVEWGLIWELDSDNRRFVLGTQKAPQAIAVPGTLMFNSALAAYYSAIVDTDLRSATIDTSNFGQAELNTIDFGGNALKRKFVQRDGSDL